MISKIQAERPSVPSIIEQSWMQDAIQLTHMANATVLNKCATLFYCLL